MSPVDPILEAEARRRGMTVAELKNELRASRPMPQFMEDRSQPGVAFDDVIGAAMARLTVSAPEEFRLEQDQPAVTESWRERIERRLDNGGYSRITAGGDWSVVVKAAVRAREQSGVGMLFHGHCGCGKTMAARLLFQSALYIICVGDTSREILQGEDIWTTPRNVLLDDLGADAKVFGREWVGEFIQEWYSRWQQVPAANRRRLVITTNLSGREIQARYKERVLSRLLEMCVVCRMTGGDKRSRA